MPMDDVYDDDGDGGAVERCTQSDDFFKLLVCSSCLSHLVFEMRLRSKEKRVSELQKSPVFSHSFFPSLCLSQLSNFNSNPLNVVYLLYLALFVACLEWPKFHLVNFTRQLRAHTLTLHIHREIEMFFVLSDIHCQIS